MNILLTAINAKYIHSNLAVYSLRAYAKKQGHEVQIAEYTINQRTMVSCTAQRLRMFLDMGHFYREKGYLDCNHSRVRRTEIFLEFAVTVDDENADLYREALLFDLYKIEKSKSRPKWAPDLSAKHRRISQYLRTLGMEKKYCHMEPFSCLRISDNEIRIGKKGEPVWILFNYEERNPLTNAAELTEVVLEGI